MIIFRAPDRVDGPYNLTDAIVLGDDRCININVPQYLQEGLDRGLLRIVPGSNRAVEKAGGLYTVSFDIVIVAASHKSLFEKEQKG